MNDWGVSDLNEMIRWSGGGSRGRESPVVRYWMRFMGAEKLGDPALDALSPALMADRADAPMLLIHGRDDTVCPTTSLSGFTMLYAEPESPLNSFRSMMRTTGYRPPPRDSGCSMKP